MYSNTVSFENKKLIFYFYFALDEIYCIERHVSNMKNKLFSIYRLNVKGYPFLKYVYEDTLVYIQLVLKRKKRKNLSDNHHVSFLIILKM